MGIASLITIAFIKRHNLSNHYKNILHTINVNTVRNISDNYRILAKCLGIQGIN